MNALVLLIIILTAILIFTFVDLFVTRKDNKLLTKLNTDMAKYLEVRNKEYEHLQKVNQEHFCEASKYKAKLDKIRKEIEEKAP